MMPEQCGFALCSSPVTCTSSHHRSLLSFIISRHKDVEGGGQQVLRFRLEAYAFQSEWPFISTEALDTPASLSVE